MTSGRERRDLHFGGGAMAVATKTNTTKPLSDEDLGKVMALIRGADSVELKVTVPDEGRKSAVAALGLDPLDAQIRQVYFFDTPDLVLNQHGLVVRARRVQGKSEDSVVKLRPVVPGELPSDVRASKNLVVEVDAMPGGYVCSASMKGTLGTPAVRDVAAGKRPIRKLFSKEQRAFYASHAPDGLELDALTMLGPINVLKLRFTPTGFSRRMVAELWLYPNNVQILELSTKCVPTAAFEVAAESRVYLSGQGIELWGEQHTKTKTALEHFARVALEETAAP
jgi:hypothetical protein